MQLRDMEPGDPEVRAFLGHHGSAVVARRGVLVDALELPAMVTYAGPALTGALTYDVERDNCEIVTLHAMRQWSGIGTALVAAVADLAVAAGCRQYWLVTTNDNTDALRFYQRRGFRLRELRRGAVDDARRTIKPAIPLIGDHGIRIRDELELAQPLPLAVGHRAE